MGLANVAATFMEAMCEDARFGYDQASRWGNPDLGIMTVECEGHTGIFWCGARDCSSAVCDAWQEALKGTPYEGCLQNATYTGNMRSVFVNSGLFEWKPMSFIAQRGDIYLNEACHTSMCVDDGRGSYGYDALAEFSINECGCITGGKPGDQTGCESSIHGYYDYPWNGILHYNGKADGGSPSPQPCGKQPKYNACSNGIWFDTMEGRKDLGGSCDNYAGVFGKPLTYFSCDCGDYQVYTENEGWLPIVNKYNTNDLVCGCAGDGTNIKAVRIFNPNIRYAVHVLGGGWLPPMEGTCDTGGSCDDFAGNMKTIDAIWLEAK